MSNDALHEALSNVALFANFEAKELAELLDSGERIDHVAGQFVFKEGESNRAIYVVVTGEVDIVLEIEGLREAVVATLRSKSVFGEVSFFHTAPHAASARCRTATSLIRISRAAFDRLLAADSRAALKMSLNAAEILASRLHATDEWLASLLSENQSAVVASWRRFREHLGSSFEPVRGFIHPY